jgi:hypothetical protein
MTTPVTRVRLRYIGKDGVACDDPSGIPWKRYVTCRCCGWHMLSWDWGRAHEWADEHARTHSL